MGLDRVGITIVYLNSIMICLKKRVKETGLNMTQPNRAGIIHCCIRSRPSFTCNILASLEVILSMSDNVQH